MWCGVVYVVCGVWWWEGGEGREGRRGVLTVCIDDVSVHATKRLAPNSGGPCKWGHDLPGPAPVCRALKNTSSAPLRDEELQAASFKTGATVGLRLPSPRRHLCNSHHL